MKKKIILLLTTLLLASCTCEYHYNKMQKKCSSVFITSPDTVILPKFYYDTFIKLDTTKVSDTLYIEKERVKIKIIRHRDTIFCKLQSPADTIIITRTVQAPIIHEKSKYHNILPWLLCVTTVVILYICDKRKSEK